MASRRAAPRVRAPRLASFNDEEDKALCIAVVSVGEDAVIGTNQASKVLWDRIFEYFEGIKPPNAPTRSATSIESRWKKINPACMRWRQALNQAIKDHKSGENDLDDVSIFIRHS